MRHGLSSDRAVGRPNAIAGAEAPALHLSATYTSQEIQGMFGLFKKDPSARLHARYAKMLEEARDLQRKGDIRNFALKTAEAEEVLKQIQALGHPAS